MSIALPLTLFNAKLWRDVMDAEERIDALMRDISVVPDAGGLSPYSRRNIARILVRKGWVKEAVVPLVRHHERCATVDGATCDCGPTTATLCTYCGNDMASGDHKDCHYTGPTEPSVPLPSSPPGTRQPASASAPPPGKGGQ